MKQTELVKWRREHVFLSSFGHVPFSQITDSLAKYIIVHSPTDLVILLLWVNLNFSIGELFSLHYSDGSIVSVGYLTTCLRKL
jgi:hypothetical protein